MMDRYSGDLLDRSGGISREALQREIHTAADMMFHYLSEGEDAYPLPPVGSPSTTVPYTTSSLIRT